MTFDRTKSRTRWLTVLLVAALSSGSLGATPEQRYFDWGGLQFDPGVYADRRSQIAATLDGGVLLIASASGRTSGGTFRQDENFLYYTGLELPSSILAIDSGSGESTVFAPARDPRFDNPGRLNDFPGRPLADDPEIARRSGLDAVVPDSDFEAALAGWKAAGRVVWVQPGHSGIVHVPTPSRALGGGGQAALIHRLLDEHSGLPVRNAFDFVAAQRMVKGPEEIELLRRSAQVTADAIRAAASRVRDGIDERSLEAAIEWSFKTAGAQRWAFDSIVKSGPNSLWAWRILAAHSDRRNRAMRDGELVIFDVGAELDRYISDVGRTFPISGRFSARQREKLEMQVSVADAIIAATRPGVRFSDLMAIAERAIPEAERPYMQTGSFFGHHIGMSPGDPALPDAVLAPGMVFTVEPWYYNHDESISVFTEDVVLVTKDGCEVLTAGLPRSPGELERMVGSDR